MPLPLAEKCILSMISDLNYSAFISNLRYLSNWLTNFKKDTHFLGELAYCVFHI